MKAPASTQLSLDFETSAATGAHALFLRFVELACAKGYLKYRFNDEVLGFTATLKNQDKRIFLGPDYNVVNRFPCQELDYSRLTARYYELGEPRNIGDDRFGKPRIVVPYENKRDQVILSLTDIEKFLELC